MIETRRDDDVRLGVTSTLRHRGIGTFVGDVLRRFIAADGTTHVRALAYQTMFVMLSGFIGLIGLASVLNIEQLRGVVSELGKSLLPGPASKLIEQAIEQGSQSGPTAAVVGLAAAAMAGMFSMAQLERGANRFVASNGDRPFVRRFAMALLLSLTVGTMLLVGALVLGGGGALESGFGWHGTAATTWAIARWPIGIIIVTVAIFAAFRFAPMRRLASARLLWAGTIVSVVLWVAFTAALAGYFALRANSSSSNPYGPLLAIIALLLWSMLTSLALHLGLAATAELSGASRPTDEVVRIPEPPSSVADRRR
jgi:YihY family inner membrane protein